jgi:hypothetical protein
MPMIGTIYRDWSEMLTPGRHSTWNVRCGQRPSLWPLPMRQGVTELVSKQKIGCGDGLVQAMAQWMYEHPDDV